MPLLSRPKYTALLLLLTVLTTLLVACGDNTEEVTVVPTATLRPTFDLRTPVSPTVTPAPTPTVTPDPRTPTRAPTRTPTPNRRLNPTPSSGVSPSPIALTPGPTPTPRPARVLGGDLISARDRDPSSLHPYGMNDSVAKEYRSLLYDAKLLKRNPQTLEWENNAALAVKYDEASNSVAFVLRSDLRWSDGTPITSEDYVWTYGYISDAGRGWLDLSYYTGKIDSYIAPDKNTLLVKLHERYSNPLELANLVEPLPKHAWDGKSWAEPDKNPNINNPTVTSGPWKLKEWKLDDRVVFERNELSSCSPPPYLKTLTFLRADNKQALEMLRAGDIDFYSPPPANLNDLNQMSKVVVYRWNPATPTWNYLGFNFRRPLWQNNDVRLAINSAVNRQEIIKNLAYGLGTAQYTDVPPGNPAFTDALDFRGFDMFTAQNLLLKAGYRLNGPVLMGPDWKDLPEITLLYNMDGEVRARLANYFARQLGALGFKVKLVSLEYQAFMSRLQDPQGDYDLFLLGWKPFSPSIEYSGSIWQGNYGGYNNPQLVELYNKATHEPDQKARRDLLVQIQKLEVKELPYIYLYANQEFMGVAAYVDGVTEGPLGVAANRYTDWFVRT